MVKTKMDMLIAKYNSLRESKPYGVMMGVVYMMTDEEHTTTRETSKFSIQWLTIEQGIFLKVTIAGT